MAQMTWRVDDGLLARVRLQADHHELSMNEFVTRVLETATNPDYSADPATQVRERLRLAGLLAEPEPSEGPAPSRELVAEAGAAAGEGTPVSQIIIDDR